MRVALATSRWLLIPLLALSCYTAQARETVGLVLAGGGARGIAHAGVIKALEEMRIPVDAVAGTSMGAVVGGLYAAGMNAQGLEQAVFTMDWAEVFKDSVPRNDRPPRRKSDDLDYPASVKAAFKDGRLSIPLGLVQGQQALQIIKSMTTDVSQIEDFDQLPIPYRAVATDIETGDAYIFDRGDLAIAMRASMSLPALLAPVEHDGRLLVDGGMAMNIPVEVGRKMGVDRLIVVDIGTPLKTREEITSLLSVSSQTMGFLTRKNSLEQLATMTDQDILIEPDLEAMGMLDFDYAQEIYKRGYETTVSLADQLRPLSLDEPAWLAYLEQKTPPVLSNPPIDYIAIRNNGPISDDIIRVRITQEVGEPLDRDQLLADIAKVYALDYWQIIDYDTVSSDKGHGLLINAEAKSWGNDKLKLGLNLSTDLSGYNEFNAGVSYLLKGVNDMGGEVYARGQIGDNIILAGEFYQPLDLRSKFFVVPYFGYEDYAVLSLGPEFDATKDIGRWRVRKFSADISAGYNLFDRTPIRLGLFRNWGEYREDQSFSGDIPEDSFNEGGVLASFQLDTLDNAFFPTSGSFFYTSYKNHLEDLGASNEFEQLSAIGQTVFSFGETQSHTLIFTGKVGLSDGASQEPQNFYQLGGLFNLSGVSQDFYSGRQMAFAMAQYEHRVSDQSFIPVDLPVYVGASIESGQLWTEKSDFSGGDLITAGSIYVAVDSPIGALYFAYGRTEDSLDALYLTLGWPFLNNNVRTGR
jgi:NTE family protein